MSIRVEDIKGYTEGKTVKERVVTALRRSILEGSLAAGKRLNQGELAEVLGVSRMPVREALRQLEAEGLVVSYPYKGFVVSKFSRAELRDIFDIRANLEALAAKSGVPRLSAADCDVMKGVLDRMDGTTDAAEWLRLNSQFHGRLYAASQRKYLNDHVDNMRAHTERYLLLYLSLLKSHDRAQAEHRAILQACRERHAERVAERVYDHLVSTRDALLDYLSAEVSE